MKRVLLIVMLMLMFGVVQGFASTEEEYNNCKCDAPRYWKLDDSIQETYQINQIYYGNREPEPPQDYIQYGCIEYPVYGSRYKYWNQHEYTFVSKRIIPGAARLTFKTYDVKHSLEDYYCRPCDVPNTPFPLEDSNFTYTNQWEAGTQGASEKQQLCSDNNGTIETAKFSCIEYERCKIPNEDVNCTEEDTEYPPLLDGNWTIEFEWSQPEDKSAECDEIKGATQERRKDCKSKYRCVTKEGCEEENIPYPELTEGQSVALSWGQGDDQTAQCYDLNGTVQNQKQSCVLNYRCVVKEGCNEKNIPFPKLGDKETVKSNWTGEDSAQSTQCSESGGEVQSAKEACEILYRCKCGYKPFPPKAENETVIGAWSEVNEANSALCMENKGSVQTQEYNCEITYRCVKETDECEVIKKVPFFSYVSPSDGTFHEDIEITGAEFGLHYSSGNLDENNTIAYGWSLSSHSTLKENRLYLGSGSLWAVDPTVEDGLTVVKSGSSELLFNSEGKHIQTRDIYTKQIETTFGYDAQGALTTVTNQFGETTTLNRDNNGTLTTITAAHGQTTTFYIDNNSSDLLEVQYEDTTSYTFEYEKHLMTLEREPNGNEFIHIFDESGKVVKVIDAEQGEWLFGETTESTLLNTQVTRASGDVVTYKKHFLENGLLKTEKILPTGDIVLYENAIDDSSASSTTCGEKNSRVYKVENGQLTKDPLHHRRILESTTQTTPSGLSKLTQFSTNYTFANNRLMQLQKTTSSNQSTITSLRDYNLSTQTITSAEGIVTTNTYDAQTQQLLSSQQGDLEVITYSYDDKGRVLEIQQGNRKTTYAYDSRGNVATITDPKDQTTSYSYDLLDRVTQTTYPDGHTTQYIYDANGNMTTLTTPTPTDHTFTYNGVNRRTGYKSPLQKATAYTYDKQRRVIKVTKPSGATIDTTYTNGRVTSIQTPEGIINYSYACQSNVSNISKGSESFNFTYDGSLLMKMVQSGVLNQTLNYSYNNDFIVNSLTYAGSTTDYTYNKDNLLIQSGPFALQGDINNSLVTKISDGIYTQKRKYNNYGELNKVEDELFIYDLKRDKTKIKSKKETITKQVPKKNGKGTQK